MLNWFLEFMGYTLQNSSYNMDSYVLQGAVAAGVLLVWMIVVLVLIVIQNVTASTRRRR